MRHALARPGAVAGVVLYACAHAAVAGAPAHAAPARSVAQGPKPIKVFQSKLEGRAGRPLAVTGRIAPASPARSVSLQVRRGGSWRTLERVRSRAGGRYRIRLTPQSALSASARIVLHRRGQMPRAVRRVGRLDVYRVAAASWYGPGLFGNRTGCGQTLKTTSVGVAHKTLKCGTRVTIRHGGRSVRVPVIDRGPYVGQREYDLTSATARKLNFTGHGPVLVTR